MIIEKFEKFEKISLYQNSRYIGDDGHGYWVPIIIKMIDLNYCSTFIQRRNLNDVDQIRDEFAGNYLCKNI